MSYFVATFSQRLFLSIPLHTYKGWIRNLAKASLREVNFPAFVHPSKYSCCLIVFREVSNIGSTTVPFVKRSFRAVAANFPPRLINNLIIKSRLNSRKSIVDLVIDFLNINKNVKNTNDMGAGGI